MKISKTRLAIGTAFWWLAALPGAAIAVMTPMMFDAPGSTENQPLIVTALLIVSFPVLAALCPVLAWIAYARSWYRATRALILAPILPVLGVVLGFAVIEYVCGGSFSCH